MKAFITYNPEQIPLRQLCRKLQDFGTINCTFEQFVEIYRKWHLTTFKGQPVSYKTATFREDWFKDFLYFLINYEV